MEQTPAFFFRNALCAPHISMRWRCFTDRVRECGDEGLANAIHAHFQSWPIRFWNLRIQTVLGRNVLASGAELARALGHDPVEEAQLALTVGGDVSAIFNQIEDPLIGSVIAYDALSNSWALCSAVLANCVFEGYMSLIVATAVGERRAMDPPV